MGVSKLIDQDFKDDHQCQHKQFLFMKPGVTISQSTYSIKSIGHLNASWTPILNLFNNNKNIIIIISTD